MPAVPKDAIWEILYGALAGVSAIAIAAIVTIGKNYRLVITDRLLTCRKGRLLHKHLRSTGVMRSLNGSGELKTPGKKLHVTIAHVSGQNTPTHTQKCEMSRESHPHGQEVVEGNVLFSLLRANVCRVCVCAALFSLPNTIEKARGGEPPETG